MKNVKTKWEDRASKMNHKSFRGHTMLIWQPPSFSKDPSVQLLPMQLFPSSWWVKHLSSVSHSTWIHSISQILKYSSPNVPSDKHIKGRFEKTRSILPLYRSPDTDICILMFKRKICKHYGGRNKWMAWPTYDFTVQGLTLLYIIEFRYIQNRSLKNFQCFLFF